MRKIFENKQFWILVRIVLGALFIYSSMDKLANMGEFAKVIYFYRMLPAGWENLLAIFLPWLEFITGLLLVVGRFNRGASLLYSSMLVIFIIALSQALLRGLDISCGCFSVKPSTTSEVWVRIILDFIMLFFSVNLYMFLSRQEEKINQKTI
ncbi:MAG: DoxX family membrane protein [Ignavibacteriae bacterium]|nr:MAG: DoxX family membrane protein [Ignavibacteriota bacterium]